MPDGARPTGLFWLGIGGVPAGPFPVDAIYARLAAGEVTWDTPACPAGGGAWTPLRDTPGVGPASPPPAAPGPAPSPPTPRPWDPAVIAGLSVLFTPVWGGVIGAVNAGRLGMAGRWWPPLAAGLGYLAVSFVPDLVTKYPPYLVDLGLYLAGVGILWAWALRPQAAVFRGRVGPAAGATAGWGWPVGLGLPLAVLAVGGFVVAPLLPMEPREVCDRFAEASSAAEAKRYATANLGPCIDVLYGRDWWDGGEMWFELTDEAPAPLGVGGYLVGYRAASRGAGVWWRGCSTW